MKGNPRRNYSSDVVCAAQICIPASRMTLQEAAMIGTCFMNMLHEHIRRQEAQKYLGESCCHHIKCMTATFLATFMWRRSLNSVTLATTTHRKPEKMSDGIGTQVEAQMINKCRIKMFQKELYNVRDPPSDKRKERGRGEKEDCSNLNCLCIQL